jgi:hypothetical protein
MPTEVSALLSQSVEDDQLPANPALRMGKYLRRGDESETVMESLTAAEVAHLVDIAAAILSPLVSVGAVRVVCDATVAGRRTDYLRQPARTLRRLDHASAVCPLAA